MYDFLLSFPREVESIWRRKFGVITILYLVIRYGTLVEMSLNVLEGTYIFKDTTVSVL